MSPQSVPVSRVLRRCGSVPCLGLLVAVLVAGCAAGGIPITSPPAVAPASPVTRAPAVTPLPAITPVPAVSPDPPAATTPAPMEIAGPPVAALTPAGADAVAGQLGSFTWQGGGSDAPWLVPPAASAIHDPGPYEVTFAPSLLVDAWTARWAPIVDGTTGDVAGFGQGGPGAVVLQGPDRPGTWSLQVDARFAGGNQGAYYWRIETAP